MIKVEKTNQQIDTFYGTKLIIKVPKEALAAPKITLEKVKPLKQPIQAEGPKQTEHLFEIY